MTPEIFGYIKNYIGNKLPEQLKGKEDLQLVGLIEKKLSLMGFTFKDIREGKADIYIDELFDEHIKNKIGDGVSYEQLYKYVEQLINNKYKDLLNYFERSTLSKVIRGVLKNVIQPEDLEYSKYVGGKYDNIFLKLFEASKESIHNECKNYILFLFSSNQLDIRINFDKNKIFLDEFVEALLSVKNIKDITSGIWDKFIISKFNLCLKDYQKQIKNKINNILTKSVDSIAYPINQIIEYVTNKILVTGELSGDELFNGKLNKYIIDYAESVSEFRIENKRVANEKTTDALVSKLDSYLLKKLREINKNRLSDKNVLEAKNMICKAVIRSNININDVLSGKNDKGIEVAFKELISILKNNNEKNSKQYDKKMSKESMKSMSLKSSDKPDKIKHNTKRKGIIAIIITLVLAAIVAIFAKADNYTKSFKELELSGDFEDIFDGIYSPENDNVSRVIDETISFYDTTREIGLDEREYGHLGFYRTYTQIRQDRLHIMDTVFRRIKNRVVSSQECTELRLQVQDTSCYLEFVMDRLYDMGCKEIRDSKYTNALTHYEEKMNDPSVEKPYDALSEEDQKIIEEIMNMYQEYCSNEVIAFGRYVDVEVVENGKTKVIRVFVNDNETFGRTV